MYCLPFGVCPFCWELWKRAHGNFVRGFFIGEQREGETKNCMKSRAKLSSLLEEMYETCLAPVLLRFLVLPRLFINIKDMLQNFHVFPCKVPNKMNKL
jgi:hypothetical protein